MSHISPLRCWFAGCPPDIYPHPDAIRLESNRKRETPCPTDLPPFSHPFITGVFSFRLMVVVGEGRGAMAPLPSRSVRNSLGVR